MSGEYDDIDFSDHSFNTSVPDDVAPDMPKKIEYVTADYDSTEFEIVSPEEAQMEHIREMKNQRFANSDFGSAVNNIEQRLGREITVDEFDKLCRSYATFLCEEDEKISKDKRVSDPSVRQKYYDDLINNRPVKRAIRKGYELIEQQKVEEIDAELQRVKSMNVEELSIKSGKPINFRYKGKVKISENSDGNIYIINNGDDVKLLNMRNRQEWLDKHFPDEIAEGKGDVKSVHNDEGFV